MKRDRIFLDEFTWPEVHEEISRSDVAYFPVGTQEGHGPHLPMGTDTYVAAATAAVACRSTGGIVLHPLAYSFTGATNAFRGTISIPMSLEIEVVKAVLRNLWEQNFRTIFVVSCHGPNVHPIMAAIRDLFEYERITAAYYNPLKHTNLDERELDEWSVEAAMCHAAMEVLGIEGLLRGAPEHEDESSAKLELPGQPRLATGLHYTDISQHCPSRKVDIHKGKEMLQDAATELIRQVADLREYARFIDEGGNPPFAATP